MSQTKKIVLAVALSIIVLLWFADEYPSLRFRGEANFSGGPVLGYQIKMRPIPFNQAGEYVFHFRGLPEEELTFILYPEGKTDKDEQELKHLETTFGAKLVDQRGQVICDASGKPLPEGSNPNGWVLRIRGDEVAYWHWNCVRMPLKPSVSYTLTLRISNVDPKTPKTNLLPVLEGGQPDLP